MKTFGLALLLLSISAINIFTEEPDIINEMFIEAPGHEKPWEPEMYEIDGNLYLIYTASYSSGNDNLQGAGIISCSKDLDINYHKIFKGSDKFYQDRVRKENDSIVYYTMKDPYDVSFYIKKKKLDGEGNIIEEYPENDMRLFADIYPRGDSILYALHIFVTDTTVFTCYNLRMDTINSFVLHKEQIDMDVLTIFQPGNLKALSNGNYQMDYAGPGDMEFAKQSYFVRTIFDSEGNYISGKKIDPGVGYYSYYNVIENKDGTEYYNCQTKPENGNQQWLLLKLNKSGDIILKRQYDFGERWFLWGIKELKNGKIVAWGKWQDVADHYKKYFMIVILSPEGDIEEKYIWARDSENYLGGVAEKDNGNLIVYGVNDFRHLYLAEIAPKYVSVEQKELQSAFIYPNPARNRIFLNFETEKTGPAVNYSISDINGKKAHEGSIGNLSAGIDTGSLSSGTYFLRLELENNIRILRFRIER